MSFRPPTCTNTFQKSLLRFSNCAIDCFLEVSCYIFKDAIAYVERNVFFEMLYTVCVQVSSGEIFVHQLGLFREPVWAWMRQCCPSFTDMSANAVV